VQTNFSASLGQLRGFSAALAALPGAVRHGTGSAPHPCDCTFCDPTATECAATVDDLNATVTPSVGDLSRVEDDVTSQVVAVGDQIIGAANGAVNNTDFMTTFVDVDWKALLESGMAALAAPREWILVVGVSFFGATFAALALTAVGLLLLDCGKYTNCTGVRCIDELDDVAGAWLIFSGWWVMGLVVVIMFLLSGVVVPVAMVLSDACGVLAELPQDMEGFLGPMMAAQGGGGAGGSEEEEAVEIRAGAGGGRRRRRLNLAAPSASSGEDGGDSGGGDSGGDGGGGAMNPVSLLIGCYQQKSLLDTLNMSSKFSFTGSLNFSALDAFDADETFNFTSFDNIRAQLALRTSASPNWLDNSRGVNGGTCDRARAAASLAWMNQDLTTTKALLNATRDATVAMHAALKMAEGDLTPLIDEVRAFMETGGNCSFLYGAYHGLEARVCAGTMPPLLNVGVAMFLNAFFGMFMVCAGLCINMRHGGHGGVPKRKRKKKREGDSDSDEEDGSDEEEGGGGERVQAWDGGKLGRALAAQDASGIEFTEMVSVGRGASSSKYVYTDDGGGEEEEDFAI
jgi:hypothetical protein